MPVTDVIKTGSEAYAERFKIMLYGFPGAGKTTLAAKSPRPLIIEFDDGGATVLRNLPPGLRDGVQWYEPTGWIRAVAFLKDLVRDKKYLETIDTIVVDTISSLQSMERENQINGVDILTTEKSPFNEAVYASNNLRVVRFIEVLLSTGKNIILTAQMTEDTITVGALQKKLIRPGLSPALTREIMATLDACFFLELSGTTRTLRVQSSPDLLTKSRFITGKQPIVRDPDWSTMEQFISTLRKPDSND